jgi:hypothetical protein
MMAKSETKRSNARITYYCRVSRFTSQHFVYSQAATAQAGRDRVPAIHRCRNRARMAIEESKYIGGLGTSSRRAGTRALPSDSHHGPEKVST